MSSSFRLNPKRLRKRNFVKRLCCKEMSSEEEEALSNEESNDSDIKSQEGGSLGERPDESIWDIIQGDDREEAVKAVMDPAIHLGMKDQENITLIRRIVEHVIDGEALVMDKLTTAITQNHDDPQKKNHSVMIDFNILMDPTEDDFISALWCAYDLQQLDESMVEKIYDHPVFTILAQVVAPTGYMIGEFVLLLTYCITLFFYCVISLATPDTVLGDQLNPGCSTAECPPDKCSRLCLKLSFMEECTDGDGRMCACTTILFLLWWVHFFKETMQMAAQRWDYLKESHNYIELLSLSLTMTTMWLRDDPTAFSSIGFLALFLASWQCLMMFCRFETQSTTFILMWERILWLMVPYIFGQILIMFAIWPSIILLGEDGHSEGHFKFSTLNRILTLFTLTSGDSGSGWLKDSTRIDEPMSILSVVGAAIFLLINIMIEVLLNNMILAYVIECKDWLTEKMHDFRNDMMLSFAYSLAMLQLPVRKIKKRMGFFRTPKVRPNFLIFCIHRSGCTCDNSRQGLDPSQKRRIRTLLRHQDGPFF